jgi:hypothetical protein
MKVYNSLDLLTVGELQGARIHNLTTAGRTGTFDDGFGVGNRGLLVFDTDLEKLFVWSGTAWVEVGGGSGSGLSFRGVVAHSAAAPGSLQNGDFVRFSSAGVATNFGGGTVEVGDFAFYESVGPSWGIVQNNITPASTTASGHIRIATTSESTTGTDDTVAITPLKLQQVTSTETRAGVIEIATSAETNTGTDDARAVTPSKLASWADQTDRQVVRKYEVSVNLTANTPATITHNLNLTTRDSYSITTHHSNAQIMLDAASTSVNALTVTSTQNLTGVRVVVIGR